LDYIAKVPSLKGYARIQGDELLIAKVEPLSWSPTEWLTVLGVPSVRLTAKLTVLAYPVVIVPKLDIHAGELIL